MGYSQSTLLDNETLAEGEERGAFVVLDGRADVSISAWGEATFDVLSYPSPDGSYQMAAETLATAVPANSGTTLKPGKLAPFLYVTIKNNGTAAAKFNLWAYVG